MLKIGVMSDSHGDRRNVERAAQILVEEEGAGLLVHLGDEYADAALLETFPCRLLRVPGVNAPEYANPKIPNRLIEPVGTVRILLTHTRGKHPADLPGDPDPEQLVAERQVDIVLYGHTHAPVIEQRDGIWFICPGHLRESDDGGHPPTCAYLELVPGKITARLFNLEGVKIEERMGVLVPPARP